MNNERLMRRLTAPRGKCSSCGRVVTIYKKKVGVKWLARRHKGYVHQGWDRVPSSIWTVCPGSLEPITKEVS